MRDVSMYTAALTFSSSSWRLFLQNKRFSPANISNDLFTFDAPHQSLLMPLGMNVNGGAAIMIRLRHPHNEKSFLPWHDILGTMCHELAHMAIGPHNADFYKLWDELSDEVERAGKSSFYNPSGGSSSFVTGNMVPS